CHRCLKLRERAIDMLTAGISFIASGHYNNGKKWTTWKHKGPLFPPEYEPLPNNFYAKMLDHEYTTKSSEEKKAMTKEQKQVTDYKCKPVQLTLNTYCRTVICTMYISLTNVCVCLSVHETGPASGE
uniref:Uncharacterized protein n=1 Tax=Hucho hucho TaxID=62062 RepID=A0A4W5QME8_9TELE